MKEKLLQYLDLKAGLESYGNGWDHLFLSVERMNPEEIQETVDFLLANGATFKDDRQCYEEMGCPETFHLWLENKDFRLYCGFVFEGDYPENLAINHYKQLAPL